MQGDSILNQALSEIGGKGLFTKELDTALLDGSVDVCVHSMKDVPTVLPEGTELYCMLQREQTNDVFISKKYKTLKDIPDGAVIGSASLRRQAQLLAMNPTWKVINFRGNVQTRLKKIENGSPPPLFPAACLFEINRCCRWNLVGSGRSETSKHATSN